MEKGWMMEVTPRTCPLVARISVSTCNYLNTEDKMTESTPMTSQDAHPYNVPRAVRDSDTPSSERLAHLQQPYAEKGTEM